MNCSALMLFFSSAIELYQRLNAIWMICSVPAASPLHVQPFVRVIVDYMDNAGGTNKSQYVLGGFGLRAAAGDFDAIYPTFMLPGHTKFDSDHICQQTGSAYNRSDVFNHGMLNSVFSPYARVHAYDGRLLYSYKEATSELFQPVKNITLYRSFAIVADDGKLQDDLEKVPGSAVNSFPEPGDVYTNESLSLAITNLAMRSLTTLIPIALSGKHYSGLGQETGLYGVPSVAKPLPPRKVRLFKRLTESCKFWIEQIKWHKPSASDAKTINLALSMPYSLHDSLNITFNGSSYSSGPYLGKSGYWGTKEEQIGFLYRHYVEPKYTPDDRELACRGASDEIDRELRELILSCEDETRLRILDELEYMTMEDEYSRNAFKCGKSGPSFQPSRPPLRSLETTNPSSNPLETPNPSSNSPKQKKVRYSMKQHDSEVIKLCGGEKSFNEENAFDKSKTLGVAKKMGFSHQTIQKAILRMKRNRQPGDKGSPKDKMPRDV